MQIKEILRRGSRKRLKRREALIKIRDKLDKRQAQIESEINSENSDNKNKMLSIKRATTRQHQKKAKELIDKIDQS